MTDVKGGQKTFKVFRYDPAKGGQGHFDTFVLDIEDYYATTILDVLFRIQREQDQSLAFRYACRVAMCGSCGMVINGKEGLACKNVVGDLRTDVITLRPLNHFPVVKDLTVDMEPFFKKYEDSMPYFEPAQELQEPAVVRPDTWERKAIDMATDCIACGCCVSSCTMAFWHKDYLGPAGLNRSMTLLADSRDGLHDERLAAAMESCYNCRLEFNCTEVCPKNISPTRAIKYIHRMAVRQGPGLADRLTSTPEPKALPAPEPLTPAMSRRRFLSRSAIGLG
ncbi:MAG: succinate dehydrogenase iron-sulfur subunit, partial [Desulfarculaceae bacterium]|nr:succinate dehydrogenase iron-sulfur subunit [Desulfarculaceae bacterium]